MAKIKVIKLDLDTIYEDGFPYSIFDIGGLGHSMIIKPENREVFLDEITAQYRKLIDESLYEGEWKE